MYWLIAGGLTAAGMFLGSLANNATEPTPIVQTPESAVASNLSQPVKYAMYAAMAVGGIMLAKKLWKKA